MGLSPPPTMYSPTSAPTNARVDVIFNDEKRNGMADGKRSFRKIWVRDAFKRRISSYTRGSIDLNPTVMLTRVGKKVIRTATLTTEAASGALLTQGIWR